ncbi:MULTISPECIES: hypothetical protein [Flavobacterium]|jgi:hypothetical protein|uniref:hypothetical protein n=1 Tax=Flavobacterium TaxID=237 RepID=UPI0011EEEBAA|nr:hypothetical protein [Flavobacterium johnsoniae]
MKIYSLIYIVLLIPICSFAQVRPEKSEVQKIIRNSKVEMKKGKFSLPSDKSWKFNNADSLYFKQDTLNAFVYKSSKHKNFCQLIDWTFYRNNAFILGQESSCDEPSTRKVLKHPSDYFTLAVYSVKNETMIDILRYDKMIVESFIVIGIEENNDYSNIKLIRRFNAN